MQEGGSELGEINISKISPFLRSHSSLLNSGRRPSCRRERQGSPSAAQAAGAVTAHFGFLSRIFLTIVLNSGGDGSDRRVGRHFFVRQVDTFSSIERGGKQTRPRRTVPSVGVEWTPKDAGLLWPRTKRRKSICFIHPEAIRSARSLDP